ncbi:MAG: YlxR family protein [Gaiella sp.]
MTKTPQRTCAGCGRRASQSSLLRFALVDGELLPGRELPGRGVYTCTSADCFEAALAQRAFARALRRQVRVDPALSRLYTEEPHG